MLHILCGKMASGKSTYSKVLESKHKAILISKDIWLAKIFGEEIKNLEDYKQQLKKRNQELPEGSRYISEEEFDMITSYFKEPLDEEGFSVERINNEISVD